MADTKATVDDIQFGTTASLASYTVFVYGPYPGLNGLLGAFRTKEDLFDLVLDQVDECQICQTSYWTAFSAV